MENLTKSEEMVMKCIWDYHGIMPSSDIYKTITEIYNKDFKSRTVLNILSKLCKKKYLIKHKVGKSYTYEAIITSKEYRRFLYKHHIANWNHNNVTEFITDMIQNGDLTEDDINQLL